MVCGDAVHGLDRRTQAQMQARIRHEAGSLGMEQKFQQQSAGDLDMSFEAFCRIYTNDLKARLKESTWQTKENIIKTKLLPSFRQAENQRDYHKRCDCMAKRAARLSG